MSADSPHRSRSQSRGTTDRVTISPQQVTDPTILDSVAGFINDVVPNAYTIPCDTKDQIQWAHFEQLECDDLVNSHSVDCDKVIPPPLLLVLGYTTGIQVWTVPASGEATELLSWRHGSVRVLKLLPTPHTVDNTATDVYISKRPLIALCDNATPGPHYCSLSFISLKTGEQVKIIKFKNPILEVLANRHSVVVTFAERIAVFDAFTLEDRLTVTTCYLSPGIYPNPIALGTRWMAYAENKLINSRRSSGGNEGEGVQSYTATVLHAAKSLGRGLRELGETVASSLTGNVPHKPGLSVGQQGCSGQNEILQKGIVTILDIESQNINSAEKTVDNEAVIAHFTAHTEAIVCLAFDPSGLLLLTADKRGHDFHLFRVHPHPGGSSLAAVHHLYILHRGDTSARVQDMCFSPDSRWATVSTLRGTTHVFPITPYGGPVGVRTHATPHVVNRMSRFHRSAGLTAEGRSNSPVSLFEAPVNSNLPYHNPRLPPYPHPTIVSPLAQIRQPITIQNSANAQQRTHSGRQRLSSSSEDNIQVVLRVSACFASPRAWIDNLTPTRDGSLNKPQIKPVESLFIMSCHGTLVQYDLDPQHVTSVPKEKICDDTPIELLVRAKAQWVLQRQQNGKDMQLPLSSDYLSYIYQEQLPVKNSKPDHTDDRWLSQVEIVTHAGPHRRLWMGPQFTFKTYNTNTGSSLNILESKPIDVGRSKPVNMPVTGTYPVLIEAGSVSSCEPSPKLLDNYQRNFEEAGGAGETQLREDLADAMLESPGVREADPLADFVENFVPITESDNYKNAIKIETPQPLDNLDFPLVTKAYTLQFSVKSDVDNQDQFDIPPLKPESTSNIEPDSGTSDVTSNIPSNTKSENKSDRRMKYDKYQGLDLKDIVSSSEENTAEEKQLSKKPRKPKTKLGVRILSINKDSAEETERKDDVEVTLPAPKKSWSSIAASKPMSKAKSPELPIETQIILPEIESVEHFTSELSKISLKDDHFHTDANQDVEVICSASVLEPDKIIYDEKRLSDDLNLLKVDKSSDEEKLENSSSQTETTESDDSSKIRIDTAMDTEEDNCQPEIIKASSAAKSNKKKSKKKRR